VTQAGAAAADASGTGDGQAGAGKAGAAAAAAKVETYFRNNFFPSKLPARKKMHKAAGLLRLSFSLFCAGCGGGEQIRSHFVWVYKFSIKKKSQPHIIKKKTENYNVF
jgi:hypothetical protein